LFCYANIFSTKHCGGPRAKRQRCTLTKSIAGSHQKSINDNLCRIKPLSNDKKPILLYKSGEQWPKPGMFWKLLCLICIARINLVIKLNIKIQITRSTNQKALKNIHILET
jgi:hypothetical protein